MCEAVKKRGSLFRSVDMCIGHLLSCVYAFNRGLHSSWRRSMGSWYRRLFCKAEVWYQQDSACLWSPDQINTSKAEIKPQQTETLTHFPLSVFPLLVWQSMDQALSQRTSEDFWSASPTCIHTLNVFTFTTASDLLLQHLLATSSVVPSEWY